MTEPDPLAWLRSSLVELYRRDHSLFRLKVGETALSFRLGHYLVRAAGDDWDVDAEYDRQGTAAAQKRSGADGPVIRPDLLIHRRGRGGSGNNLMLVEVKRYYSRLVREDDMGKVRAAVAAHDYRYGVALALTDNRTRPARFGPRWWVYRGTTVVQEDAAVFDRRFLDDLRASVRRADPTG